MSSDDFSGLENFEDFESRFRNVAPKQRKHPPEDGFNKNKVVNQVLDKTTMFTMYEMINAKIIAYVNGIVKAGKESVLFWAVDPKGNDVALKVYLTSTSSFKNRAQYIVGDPRFLHLKKGTRNLVYLWAKKSSETWFSVKKKEFLQYGQSMSQKMCLQWILLEQMEFLHQHYTKQK